MDSSVEPAAIRRALHRLLQSDTLAGSDQLRKLLEYLVRNTLAGRYGELNEIAIAESVLGRGKDFVALADSSARKAMSRLRAKLRIYYADEGRAEPICFVVRRYRVRFRTRAPTRPQVLSLEFVPGLRLAAPGPELFLEPDACEIPIVADVADRRAEDLRSLFE